MAEVTSLGVHTPVGLPYLVAEGILPREPKNDQYQWDIYVAPGCYGDVEEEVLATKSCVVWSQGKFVRNVYRFELEGEDVVQAILTDFPNRDESKQGKPDVFRGPNSETRKREGPPKQQSAHPHQHAEKTGAGSSSRALVVFLKSKAHIYFLHGSNHIVGLPFEIERAFPAPRGLVVQRKRKLSPSLPPTPNIPAAPPNSFFSSQLQPSSSHLQSPTFSKSFGKTLPAPAGASIGNVRLDALFQDMMGSLEQDAEEDTASLYSLTNPIADFGVVTYSVQHQKPRFPAKGQPSINVEFETLDSAEQIVYMSPRDELNNARRDVRGPLILVVTFNHELQTLTVWHAWYIEERTLASLMKQRAAHKAAKARRRSSFLNVNLATGAATPGTRHREGTRESLVFGGSIRLPGESAPSHPVSRKPTRQEEEETMALQMDPDYQPAASLQAARESRRVSSLNTDVRASQNVADASFGGPAGRRNTSFGRPSERRSFLRRKSRGSTPGSTFGQSLGVDDDLMDLDGSLDADGEEAVQSVLRHMRATFETAGAESVFGEMDEGPKRDLIVRKLQSFPVPSSNSPSAPGTSSLRICTLTDGYSLRDSHNQRLNVYVHNRTTHELHCVHLTVEHRALWPEMTESRRVAVPMLSDQSTLGQCSSIAKLTDNYVHALLLSGRGLLTSLDERSAMSNLPTAPYRVYDPFEDFTSHSHGHWEVGKNRTVQGPAPATVDLRLSGAGGTFDEAGDDGVCHRRMIKLRPRNAQVNSVLDVCRFLLPAGQAQMVTSVWSAAHGRLIGQRGRLDDMAQDVEWVALVATIFAFAIHIIDDKARASLNLSSMAAGKHKNLFGNASRIAPQVTSTLRLRGALWDWMNAGSDVSFSDVSSPEPQSRPNPLLVRAATLAGELRTSMIVSTTSGEPVDLSLDCIAELMLGLHIFREEQKLCTLTANSESSHLLAPVIAQLGHWLGLDSWSHAAGQYYDLEMKDSRSWSFVKTSQTLPPHLPLMREPVGVFQWFEHSLRDQWSEAYPTLSTVAGLGSLPQLSQAFVEAAHSMTPRIVALSEVLVAAAGFTVPASVMVETMAKRGITSEMMETLPEAVAAPFKEAIARCEREPPTTWSSYLLNMIGREDLDVSDISKRTSGTKALTNGSAPKDVHTITHSVESQQITAKTKEASRHAISQLIFSEDRRLVEATSLMHFNSSQIAECAKQPEWTDAFHFEQQRRVMQWVTTRMIALPSGDGMIHFDCQTPLLTEKYHLPGFSNSCLMLPMNHTLTTDRSGLTEDKVNWAYFHAGVSAGLRISRTMQGIDTSWISFNKPNELTNRHAGLLLALGLNGHLKNVAKWLSFKYLTPKHNMTSVGLLLGLSASHIGTMDGLITRMLSVHITRMLPPGAAELNVSSVTQTAGLIGIGLLYYNSQHRRMSEIMLSEVEHMELEDPDSGPDPLRDESYRLAAGFALGFINLGKGKDLRGLHGMYLPERLLGVAVGPRPVRAVHVFDKATAGAIIALTLVYMKSGDRAIARKIDIPDTEAQFDHVRPDMLMLRAMAKHVILWDDIQAKRSGQPVPEWTLANLPACYKDRFNEMFASYGRHPLTSAEVPLYNVTTGLLLALSLKYAGSGDVYARDEILFVLDYFTKIKGGTEAYYYDAKLARSTVRRCVDVLALAASTVMAGTGDLTTFRYLRRLHGRTDAETPYGSHLAAHMAIGMLFLGGGTYTFGTSDLAIASLICAFYPLFPTDVHDNHVHLQALRHFWVFAAEARCLVVEDIDTHRPVPMPIVVGMLDGEKKQLKSPCLLPGLDRISTIQTSDPTYWPVTLDFARNPDHLSAFRQNQRIFARRCPASEAHSSVFFSTFAALNDAQSSQMAGQIWHSVFNLPVFRDLAKADIELILPPDLHSSIHTDERGTAVDDRMALSRAVARDDLNALRNLRMLFAWAEKARDEGDGRLRWLGAEVIEGLKARIEERLRGIPVNVE